MPGWQKLRRSGSNQSQQSSQCKPSLPGYAKLQQAGRGSLPMPCHSGQGRAATAGTAGRPHQGAHRQPRVHPRRISTVSRLCTVST